MCTLVRAKDRFYKMEMMRNGTCGGTGRERKIGKEGGRDLHRAGSW